MHLSVTRDTYLTVLTEGGVIQRPVHELTGPSQVVNWWGGVEQILVTAADQEEQYLMTSTSSGEPFFVGETHSALVRDPVGARWERVLAKDIKEPVFVKLPQRKVVADESLFDVFDIDDKGIFLKPEKGSQMADYMRKAAFCGLSVHRHKAELRIDLDKGRAPCFGTKLITGSFSVDLVKTLETLVAGNVVNLLQYFDEGYIKQIQSSSVIHEGPVMTNDVPFLPPRALDKSGPVYHIKLSNPLTPVELTWCSN
jgi:hypothetical protein